MKHRVQCIAVFLQISLRLHTAKIHHDRISRESYL